MEKFKLFSFLSMPPFCLSITTESSQCLHTCSPIIFPLSEPACQSVKLTRICWSRFLSQGKRQGGCLQPHCCCRWDLMFSCFRTSVFGRLPVNTCLTLGCSHGRVHFGDNFPASSFNVLKWLSGELMSVTAGYILQFRSCDNRSILPDLNKGNPPPLLHLFILKRYQLARRWLLKSQQCCITFR